MDLLNQDRAKVNDLGRAGVFTLKVHQSLLEHPLATSGSLVEKTGSTPVTVNKAL